MAWKENTAGTMYTMDVILSCILYLIVSYTWIPGCHILRSIFYSRWRVPFIGNVPSTGEVFPAQSPANKRAVKFLVGDIHKFRLALCLWETFPHHGPFFHWWPMFTFKNGQLCRALVCFDVRLHTLLRKLPCFLRFETSPHSYGVTIMHIVKAI